MEYANVISYQQKLDAIQAHEASFHLEQSMRGIEKESLRITPDGYLSQAEHPKALGSALTHPSITTDYSEALIELITPASQSLDDVLSCLTGLHQFTYQHIGDELLWATSMPCMLTSESDIPIAYYGRSHIGRMKYLYRVGLANRYGKMMQTISGVHYNFSVATDFWPLYQTLLQDNQLSLQDFISHHYFVLLRNYHRISWLIPYLFGASPAMCKSFVKGRQHQLEPFDDGHSLYLPNATSLRMSDLGYQNTTQQHLNISYNGLQQYVEGLREAIATPDESFSRMGVKSGDEYLQLNSNVLQIENEYYSSIRPKRVTRSLEKPSSALLARGVEYVELRALDVDPFAPNGVGKTQARFVELFLLYCLLQSDQPISAEEEAQCRHNMHQVVLRGREQGLALQRDGQSITLQSWALQLMDEMQPLAQLLDRAHGCVTDFQTALYQQRMKVLRPELTPSAMILANMRQSGLTYYRFAKQQALRHQIHFARHAQDQALQQRLMQQVEASWQQQNALEQDTAVSFETFLQNYFQAE